MSGWVKVHRNTWSHSFFKDEPMSEREAWLWMVSNAAWNDTTHRVGSEIGEVPRGSFMATLRELQGVFKWKSDTKVRNFLSLAEQNGMIERTVRGARNAPKTLVTICNYCKFQDIGDDENAPKTHQVTPQKRTKNAVKKEINNKTNKKSIPPKSPEDILASVVDSETARDFVAHRISLKNPLTDIAAKRMVSALRNHPNPASVFDQSIQNGWKGIFPDKIKGNQNGFNHSQDRETSTVEHYAKLAGFN